LDEAIGTLKALRELGIELGLDDFGMGYSALSYLQQLPVQTLKIDRSFVSGIQNAGNVEIVRAILSLASGLSMNRHRRRRRDRRAGGPAQRPVVRVRPGLLLRSSVDPRRRTRSSPKAQALDGRAVHHLNDSPRHS
jgi:hypothetical protein